MLPILINIFAFYIGWFACVLGGAYGLPWLGTALALAIVVRHIGQAMQPWLELRLALLAGLLGVLVDSLPVAAGLVDYPSGTVLTGMAPYWIVALWMLFATTLNVSLRWLKGRLLLAAVLGAIAGPPAYYAGAGLGAITLLQAGPALLLLALLWSMAMPLLVSLATRYDGMAETDRQSAAHNGSAKAEKPA